MTRSSQEIKETLALGAQGFSASVIARQLGIPRSTIRDWLVGRVPSGRTRPGPCCETCGNDPHLFAELPSAYVYLLGLYLGDGCIATHPRAYKLRVILDSSYPGIIEQSIAAIQAVAERNKVNTVIRPGCTEVYAYSKAWPCLFPQHGPGKKHHRKIELAEWQWRLVRKTPHLLLRGLIHSDGCRSLNTGRRWVYPRYSFTNLSSDIRKVFTDACDLLALRWTSSKGHRIYVSRKADVDRMDRFIGPKA